MAISIKSDTLYSGSTPTVTLIGGNDTNQRVLFFCAWNQGDGSALTALSVGGNPANFLGNRVFAGGVEASVSVFEMINLPAGNYALAVTGNGTGSIPASESRWRVVEIDNVGAGGAFVSNVLNGITAQPATASVNTTDVAAGDLVLTYYLVGEGWQGGAAITSGPTLTNPQTVNVTFGGAVSAHHSGYFTAAASDQTVSHQISGFSTPGGNIDRSTVVAVRFKESAPLPDFTIGSDFEPGETVTIVAANYPSVPTQITLTDAASNDITLSLTSAGGNNYAFTMPALPAAGSDAVYLRFGSVTATVGAVSKPSVLQVATTQTMATLASGFDDYVFQGWTPQPAVGDQLVTVAVDGIFNSNGDYTFYADGVYPVWYVDGAGQVYGRTIDTSGLGDLDVSLSSTLTPGATITATLVNYPSLPTTVTIADSLGNDIVLPLTATGATTATFTVPALASSNAGQEYLQFGAVNLTFGSKTISSTFSPVSPLSYVNLIAPVATNAFEVWGSDVPVAGEQLISEGNFDINGNFTGADPDATYTCWITRLNGDNHRFTVQQGSAEPPNPASVLTLQDKKLALIVAALLSHPTLSVNDAIMRYLQNLYSSNKGISDLIARFLGE